MSTMVYLPTLDGSARRAPNASSPRSMRGVGLIEVLIAVLVMAIGMLGIAALQATSLRNSQSSLERGNAVIQSYAILDAMRANPAGTAAGAYNTGGPVCAPPAATTLASRDINLWISSIEGMLNNSPNTCGSINCAAGICTVTVQWDDSRGGTGGADASGKGSATNSITTVSRL